MRTIKAAPLLTALTSFVAVSTARAGGITITEKPGHVTEARATIDATPAQIYALVTDYAHWVPVLTDIKSVTVESGGRRNATVRFTSRVLEHEVTVVFDNDVDRMIRFRGIKGPPGGRASGTYVLTPIDGGRRTEVTAHLYLDVVGVVGVFVSDSKIRAMRQAKLRADLTDVKRYFASGQVLSQTSVP